MVVSKQPCITRLHWADLVAVILSCLVCPVWTTNLLDPRAIPTDACAETVQETEAGASSLEEQQDVVLVQLSLDLSNRSANLSESRHAQVLRHSPDASLHTRVLVESIQKKHAAWTHNMQDIALQSAESKAWIPWLAAGCVLLIVFLLALSVLEGFRASCREFLKEVTLADLPRDRRLSYLFFGVALGITLATLQFIGPVRTSVFFRVVGTAQEPLARSLVLVVLLPIVLLYSLCVSVFPTTKALVIAVNSFYTLWFLLVTMALAAFDGDPPKWVAWALYMATETKSVILMPMTWSVINDVSSPELAKKAYPFIFFVSQLGGIGGSFMAIQVTSLGGEVGLLAIQTFTLALIGVFIWAGCAVLETDPHEAASSKLSPGEATSASCSTAVLKMLWDASEGLWLLFSRPYVFMTFFVSYATLVTRTVLDYENSVMVQEAYPVSTDQVAYFGRMTLVQNSIIAVITLLGTRKIMERFSIGTVMAVLPLTSLVCIAAVCVNRELLTSTIAANAAAIVAYSLNSPSKEILFVRTSREIKYKAKSWSEMYGNNVMKIMGAQINMWVNNESAACKPDCFHPGPTFAISGVWVSLWIGVVFKVGKQFQELEAENKIIE